MPANSENNGDHRPSIIVSGPTAGSAALVVHDDVPATMMVLPLRRAVAFPNLMMPILLDSTHARDIVAKAEAGNSYLLLLTQKDPDEDRPTPATLYDIGIVARVLKVLKLPDGNASVMCQGMHRAKATRFVRKRPFLVAKVKTMIDIPAKGRRSAAVFRKLREALQRVVAVSGSYGEDFSTAVLNIDQPDQLADFTGGYFLKGVTERQQLLDAIDVGKRLELALEFVLAELELAELGNRIQEEIRAKVEEAQKEYFLREQMKIIRRELGEEQDAREAELARLEQAVTAAEMPEDAGTRAADELAKLRTTPVESAEYGVVRNYLDWLTALPWSVSTTDRRDLRVARAVLDEDHYGLEEVKDRILEFLAVRRLRPDRGGSILCFAGPPGVGKTSLGRSIARATGRKFWRFSLGGMRDEAEIKGHRRTYIGAMPGRILQGLKACGTNNPVIMLDEIDKLGADFRGDPASALLEVLDPEQNSAFLDHYLDVPFDLSKVMFISTANALPQIPEPLRDRMEVIDIAGYLEAEKVQIGRRHLVPKQLERHGLATKQLGFTVPVLTRIVRDYTREAGVRRLEQNIVKVCRKVASAVVSRRKTPGRLKLDDVEKFLGQPRYGEDGERRVRVPGVVQGLSWTPHGGDVLFIEAAAVPGKGRLELTGSLGDVMSESCRIALGYLASHAAQLGLTPETFAQQDFHVHFPAGAIPKDGPSAGISIATALVSLVKNEICPAQLAMTGELTLVGEVLPVGGIREKVLAAQRLRLRRVILPSENRRDIEELKPELVRGLRFSYVDEYREVFEAVFGKVRPRSSRRTASDHRGGAGA